MSREWNIMSDVVTQFKSKAAEMVEEVKRTNKFREFVHPEEVAEELGAETVYEKVIDTTRWSTVHEQVIKMPCGRHVMVMYRLAATENQEHDSTDTWGVIEVQPKEVTVTKYVKVK